MIETGRYINSKNLQDKRLWPVCDSNEIEDEIHFSVLAQNILNLEMNFSLKNTVISIIFSSYPTRTWWLNWSTPKIVTINPLLSPPGRGGGLFILNPFEEEGLIETGRPIYFRKDDGISSP